MNRKPLFTLAPVLAAGLALWGCLSDYKDSYKLRKDNAYVPFVKENTLPLCGDKADNDNNGLVDCDDPGCSVFEKCNPVSNPDKRENTLARCSNAIDDDSNGVADCDDPNCKVFQRCQPVPGLVENTATLCADKVDNNNNGLIDCADVAGCGSFSFCRTDTLKENTAPLCSDGVDNNANGLIDCADVLGCGSFTFCRTDSLKENTALLCGDKVDNDKNGLIDCLDPGCTPLTICLAKVENTAPMCKDGADNNGNGLIDCLDTAGCSAFDFCRPPVENTPALCQDSKDNDNDGFIDCKDSDCKAFLVCNPTENTLDRCKDGLDNDGDLLIDCKDPDCKDLFVCSVPDQDTVFILGYKTTGKLTPAINATLAPYNLKWYFNGGDAPGSEALGTPGIMPGRNEEATACGVEPRCRRITYTASWGIAFTIFFDNQGLQDTINLSSWIGSALKFSINAQVTDLRVKIESRNLNDAVEVPLTATVGYDPAKTGWQNVVIPLLNWTTGPKMEFNRLPFSLTKPEGVAGGTVLLENIRIEKAGVSR